MGLGFRTGLIAFRASAMHLEKSRNTRFNSQDKFVCDTPSSAYGKPKTAWESEQRRFGATKR